MTRTGGDTRELTELARAITRRRRYLADVLDDAADAITRFERRSTQFVPHLPPHRASGDELTDRLADVASEVRDRRDALAAADRWVGRRYVAEGLRLDGGRQTATASVHGAVVGWALFRRAVLDGDLDEVAESWLDEQSLRGLVRGTRTDVDRLLGRASLVTREVTAQSGRVARARAAFGNTRVAAVTRLGSRALGVVGVVGSGVASARSWTEGDTEGVVTNGLSAAASVAMLSGVAPLQVAGAVVQGGLLVYEHRATIAAAGTAIGGALRSGMQRLF